MAHHIIYIPGILDDIAKVQSTLVKTWRWYGVVAHTHVMPWLGDTKYRDTEEKLITHIKELSDHGNQISLVGGSAGATAAINAYIAYPNMISSVALICPKIHNSKNISTKIAQQNPSFIESIIQLETNLPSLSKDQRGRIVNFISPRDGYVPYKDSSIADTKEISLPGLRHNAAIIYALSFGGRKIVHQLNRIAQSA